jgi:hypothetical protein
MYCNVLGVLFKMDVCFYSKTQHTAVKYNQQLSKHRTIPRQALGAFPLFRAGRYCHTCSPSLNPAELARRSW